MAAVRSRDTAPERRVRAAAQRLRRVFRRHAADLPGCPDLVFDRARVAVFVHGCFWHQHTCKRGRRTPGTNREYWLAKFGRNVRRDKLARRRLRGRGWHVLTIWECQTADIPR